MTQSFFDATEERFLGLRETVTQKDWVNVNKLMAWAEHRKEADPALAHRILQRARNLEPENLAVVDALAVARNELKKKYPQALRSSSRVNKLKVKNVKKNLESIPKKAVEHWSKMPSQYRSALFLSVILPILLYSFYQLFWATDRYESQSQVIVKQPDASSMIDPAMALLSGMGVPASSADSMLLDRYIYSADMMEYLDKSLDLRDHYSWSKVDFFSRVHKWDSKEDFLAYFQRRVHVEIDGPSNVISIKTQGFTPEFAQLLNESIVARAEWYINDVGHSMAKRQMDFMHKEHERIQKKLRDGQAELLEFQGRYNLLDPASEGAAFQQITYTIESQLSIKRAELNALKGVMSDVAPAVITAQGEIDALIDQIESERRRLSPNRKIEGGDIPDAPQEKLSVGEILAGYSDLKVAMELALQAYTASLVSLEKARIEAYRQLQYLIRVESPTRPEEAKYPRAIYNIMLFSVLLMVLFGVIKIVIATIKELS